jgi:hypothetical protein
VSLMRKAFLVSTLSCLFFADARAQNVCHTMAGDVKSFVAGVTPGGGKLVVYAALDYDPDSDQGARLSELGQLCNSGGIVVGRKAKSGWVNADASGTYTNLVPGKTVHLTLSGLTFWVNDGGNNWLNISIRKAVLDGREVSVKAGIESTGPATSRAYVLLDDKYRLTATIGDLQSLALRPVAAEGKAPPK